LLQNGYVVFWVISDGFLKAIHQEIIFQQAAHLHTKQNVLLRVLLSLQ
jgi:hypothetical protein